MRPGPKVSDGLARLLDEVAARMPVAEVEAVWVFPPLRRGGREHGVAVVSRVAGDGRRRVYRARYTVGLATAERGKVTVELEPAAEGPPELVAAVIDGVRRRADEAGEAELLDLTAWKEGSGGGAPVA